MLEGRSSSTAPFAAKADFADLNDAVMTTVGELTHRLRNVLALVDAITRQTLIRSAADRAIAATLSKRFAALAAVNDVFLPGSCSADICDTVRDALAPFIQISDERIVVDGPPIVLDATLSLALRMILHELATNAVKHGALSDASGRLSIAWACSSTSRDAFSFSWIERSGFEIQPPTRRGFGTTLIGRVLRDHVDQLPEVNFDPDGVRFEFTARLAVKGNES